MIRVFFKTIPFAVREYSQLQKHPARAHFRFVLPLDFRVGIPEKCSRHALVHPVIALLELDQAHIDLTHEMIVGLLTDEA